MKKTNGWKKSALFMKEWWSGAHSVFENGSERVSALIFSLMSESWAKLKKLMSVEHVAEIIHKSNKQESKLKNKDSRFLRFAYVLSLTLFKTKLNYTSRQTIQSLC